MNINYEIKVLGNILLIVALESIFSTCNEKIRKAYLSAQKRFEFPSNMLTMSSSLMPGRTHSFFDHTPEPNGQTVFPTRSSKRAYATMLGT